MWSYVAPVCVLKRDEGSEIFYMRAAKWDIQSSLISYKKSYDTATVKFIK